MQLTCSKAATDLLPKAGELHDCRGYRTSTPKPTMVRMYARPFDSYGSRPDLGDPTSLNGRTLTLCCTSKRVAPCRHALYAGTDCKAYIVASQTAHTLRLDCSQAEVTAKQLPALKSTVLLRLPLSTGCGYVQVRFMTRISRLHPRRSAANRYCQQISSLRMKLHPCPVPNP
jgi:hypothetical protein